MKRWELETAHGKPQVAHEALLAERNSLQARISGLESAVGESQERVTKLEEQLREALRSAGTFRRSAGIQRGGGVSGENLGGAKVRELGAAS